MSLIESYFGKNSIEEITHDDIIHFFSIQRKENDKIEFKSFDIRDKKGKTEDKFEKEQFDIILQSIVAFLNSDGGILIWGAPNGTIEGKEKVFTGSLTYVPFLYGDDQLISKITDKINPNPSKIRKKIINNKEGNIYVFEVERSEYSPHQVNNIFYMRIDGVTKIAPYHYIDALFKKIKSPNIKGFLKIEGFQTINQEHLLHITIHLLNYSVFINEFNPFYRIKITMGEFQSWTYLSNDPRIKINNSGKDLIKRNVQNVLSYGDPFSERQTIKLANSHIDVNGQEFEIEFYFGADSSPIKINKYKIKLDSSEKVDFIKFFTYIDENKTISEYNIESGSTDEIFIENLLGRKVKL